ncbi:MAG: hypothetical protein NT028_10285 [candidate division Zixibacteria bacterium]|nr:hypothetical protein [candidate division Zixibacteria bacterium]
MSRYTEKRDIETFKYLLKESVIAENLISGESCDPPTCFAHGYFTRQVLTCTTLLAIFEGARLDRFMSVQMTRSPSGDIVFDYPTAVVLVRVLYGTYLKMYFIADPGASNGEKAFRSQILELHAAKKRLRLVRTVSPESRRLAELQSAYDDLVAKVASSELFAGLTKDAKESLTNEAERRMLWNSAVFEIRKAAGISDSYHKSLYEFSSDYIHSDGLALQQIQAVRSQKDSIALMRIPVGDTIVFLASSLHLLTQVSPKVAEHISRDRELYYVITFWNDFRRLFDPCQIPTIE